MLQYIDNRINYNYSLCQQCGICEAVCPKQAISFKLLKNGIHKVVIDDEKCIRCLRCVKSALLIRKKVMMDISITFRLKSIF